MAPHETFMRRALDLARRGGGRVEPNPLVGAVIVRGGRIIAGGWHDSFGGPHAEVNAIRAAGRRTAHGRSPLRGSTLHVTLEPCTHFGKTPPCAPFVIESGVRRVVIATRDPNPVNTGRGVALLRRAGIEVVEGVCRREAEALNAPFYKLHRTGWPWVIAKWAMSADGRIATRTGSSRWITGPAARNLVHEIRARCQAVVIGIGTALADDPALLPEYPPPNRGGDTPPIGVRRPYVRVVLDSLARLPLRSRLVRSAREVPVLVAVSARASASRCRRLERAGCEVLTAGRSRPDPDRLLRELGRRNFTHVLVEGGGGVHGAFFDARRVDEVYAFVAPKVIGGSAAPSPVGGRGMPFLSDVKEIENPEWIPVGKDMLFRGRMAHTKPVSVHGGAVTR